MGGEGVKSMRTRSHVVNEENKEVGEKHKQIKTKEKTNIKSKSRNQQPIVVHLRWGSTQKEGVCVCVLVYSCVYRCISRVNCVCVRERKREREQGIVSYTEIEMDRNK